MSRWPAWAARLVGCWVAVYTRGLPCDIAQQRRDELASDVWEHERDARAAGVAGWVTAMRMLARLVSGMPADMVWRIPYRQAQRAAEREAQRRAAEGKADIAHRVADIVALSAFCAEVAGLIVVSGDDIIGSLAVLSAVVFAAYAVWRLRWRRSSRRIGRSGH